MIRITLSQRPDGKDIAACGPHRVIARNGATMALARQLIAAGFPDTPWEAVGADGRIRLQGPSLHAWARWTMSETDSHGLRRVPYVSDPRFHRQQATASGFSAPTAIGIPPGPENPSGDATTPPFAHRDEPSHD